jgi:nucleoside-diphosphate kinase
MEQTLVILKPCAIQRGLIGEVIHRFENKGLQICGMKMMQLDDTILAEHYSHLAGRSFFQRVKDYMMISPVIVMCVKGMNAVQIVHNMAGVTHGKDAAQGTIRGDYSLSVQENIVHTSDSLETAAMELNRFFKKEEIFDYPQHAIPFLYASDELT